MKETGKTWKLGVDNEGRPLMLKHVMMMDDNRKDCTQVEVGKPVSLFGLLTAVSPKRPQEYG